MKILSVMIAFSITLTSGCAQAPHPTVSPMADTTRLAFIIASDGSEGIYAGTFGDIVILGVESRATIRVTKDTFIDESPQWAPDGKSIAFLSSRAEGHWRTQLRGLGSPLGLYEYRLADGEIRRIGTNSQFKMGIDSVYCFAWMADGTGLFVSRGDTIVYRVGRDTDSISVYTVFKGGVSVTDISSSPDGRWVAFACSKRERFKNGYGITNSLAVMDIETREIRPIPQECIPKNPWIQGWNSRGDGIIHRKMDLTEYSPGTGECNTYLPSPLKDRIVLGDMAFANDGRMFFSRDEEKGIPKAILSYDEHTKEVITVFESPMTITFDHSGLWRPGARK